MVIGWKMAHELVAYERQMRACCIRHDLEKAA